MRTLLYIIALGSALHASAQKHDNVWLLGYAGGNQSPMDDYFGLSILTFDADNHFSIENNQTSNLNFNSSNSSFCDSTGHLLFYSNAERIYNADHQQLINGGGLNINNQYGARQPQGVLSLPMPGHNRQFLVLVSEIKTFSQDVFVAGWKIYENILVMDSIHTQGEVMEKKVLIINDTLEYGQITAAKHANGQDWWILIPEIYSDRYYTLLLDNNGLSVVDTQKVNGVFLSGGGQACFSPDGKKYARANHVDLNDPARLYIYDFDRCTGKLSNPVYLEYETWGTGCAISRNSRFLYAINASYVFQ
ncbi:MAG: hypothetical protein R2791_02450 [Saprospiraceae bacterium]